MSAELTVIRSEIVQSDRRIGELAGQMQMLVELVRKLPQQPAAPKPWIDAVPPTPVDAATPKALADAKAEILKDLTDLRAQVASDHGELRVQIAELKATLGSLDKDKIEGLQQRLERLDKLEQRLAKLDQIDKLEGALRRLDSLDLGELARHRQETLEHIGAIQRALLDIAAFLAGESVE